MSAPQMNEDGAWDELWDTDAARSCSCPACNFYAPDFEQHQGEDCILKTLIERIIFARGALPDPNGGCACPPFSQSAGGGYVEHLAEYEPACPVHSEHLYDPRSGVWILRDAKDGDS